MTLISNLRSAAANLQQMKLRTHVHHVNIKGKNFVSDHEYLGELYSDFDGYFDTVAELIRINQQQLTMSYLEESMIPTPNTEFDYLDSVKIFKDVLLCVGITLNSLYVAHSSATKENKIGTYTELETIIAALEKTRWKLESITA